MPRRHGLDLRGLIPGLLPSLGWAHKGADKKKRGGPIRAQSEDSNQNLQINTHSVEGSLKALVTGSERLLGRVFWGGIS
jgi:hypothetical protein